jgi:glycogen debranching enzyme
MAEWLNGVAKIETSNEEFYRLFRQALEDMAALRLPIKGTDHMVFLPAAGLPWFVAPFGRDSLIVSLQNILIYPEFARGTLEILGSLQANDDDSYRDAEPGKILHEMRYGELAHFKLIPHTPYYGTADATPLYLITLHSAWRATVTKRCWSSICRRPNAASSGSTNTATVTAMDFRNTRRARLPATRTWVGRIRAIRSCTLMAHW